MIDYSELPINVNMLYSGKEKKYEVEIDGYKYIMKFQKLTESGPVYNHLSEYLCSKVIEMIGHPVHETYLGTYKGENVVIMKNFLKEGETFYSYNQLVEAAMDEEKGIPEYNFEDIQNVLESLNEDKEDLSLIEGFWEMYVIDALNGNSGRTGDNWGVIKKGNYYSFAPLFSNSKGMYPNLNTDQLLENTLASEKKIDMLRDALDSSDEIDKRVYKNPASAIYEYDKKSSYYDIINGFGYFDCNEALKRVVHKINIWKIEDFIDEIEGISDIRKQFYKEMYANRYKRILLKAYNRL